MQRIKSHKKKKKADAEMAKIESEQVQHRKRVACQGAFRVSISKQQTLKGPAVEPSEDGARSCSPGVAPVVKVNNSNPPFGDSAKDSFERKAGLGDGLWKWRFHLR